MQLIFFLIGCTHIFSIWVLIIDIGFVWYWFGFHCTNIRPLQWSCTRVRRKSFRVFVFGKKGRVESNGSDFRTNIEGVGTFYWDCLRIPMAVLFLRPPYKRLIFLNTPSQRKRMVTPRTNVCFSSFFFLPTKSWSTKIYFEYYYSSYPNESRRYSDQTNVDFIYTTGYFY